MENTSITISDELKQQYQDEGYFILRDVIPEEDLRFLQQKADELVAEQDEKMEELGTDELELSRKDSRYFVFLAYQDHPELGDFVFSDLMEEICKATVGDTSNLFWEQFVVKGTKKQGAEFTWHQDSGYVDTPHKKYVNAWIPLDDVSEENGTIHIIPYSRAGTSERVEHEFVEGSNDRVGYFGDDPGDEVKVPAGSIAVFSSTSFHRSGPNKTDKPRRAYAVQWAPETIYEPDGSVKGIAEPFLKDGKRVR